MSDIKLRAWSKELNQFFYVDDSYSISIHDTGITVIEWSSDEVISEFPVDNLMQSTGVNDRNGKEIWFGDFYYVAGYGVLHLNNNADIITLFEAIAENDLGMYKGNIYENPELINKG